MIPSEFFISFFCAGVSSTLGCFVAYFVGRKSLRFLIAEWFILVFAFTFLLAILTFSEGGVAYVVNLYAPVVIPLFSFLGVDSEGGASVVDYLIVWGVLFLFVVFFGWFSGRLISELMVYGIGFVESSAIVIGGLMFCFFVSFCGLRKYRLVVVGGE